MIADLVVQDLAVEQGLDSMGLGEEVLANMSFIGLTCAYDQQLPQLPVRPKVTAKIVALSLMLHKVQVAPTHSSK